MNIKSFFLITLLAWVAISGSRVQAEPKPEPRDLITTAFTVICCGRMDPPAYLQGGHLQSLQLSPFKRSPVYTYTGPAELTLYPPPLPGEKKDAVPPNVGTIRFTPGVKRHTVLLFGSEKGYESRVIVDDQEKFPVGTVRLYNLCPIPVAVRCNQSATIQLAPNQSEIVKPRADQVVITESAYQLNGEWIRADDDFIPARPTDQTSVFFLISGDKYFVSTDGVSRQMQMVVLREKPESAPTATASAK